MAGQVEQAPATTLAHLISVTAREVLHQPSLTDSGKRYLSELYKDNTGVQLLVDIKGIGLDSALAIVLEIENVGRFETAKKLASYFRVHPRFKQSRDGFGGNHLSRKGRGDLRVVFYMVGILAIRYNPLFATLYARL